MNIVLLYSWLYGSKDECQEKAQAFYDSLRLGEEKRIKFPLKCPYQVHLLSNQKAIEFVVAVVVMRGTQVDDSVETDDKVKQWFSACGASGWEDSLAKPLTNTIRSTLTGLSFNYLENFGTINKETGVLPDRNSLSSVRDRSQLAIPIALVILGTASLITYFAVVVNLIDAGALPANTPESIALLEEKYNWYSSFAAYSCLGGVLFLLVGLVWLIRSHRER